VDFLLLSLLLCFCFSCSLLHSKRPACCEQKSKGSNSNPLSSALPPRPRDTTPGQGWNLPARRKFRFRLEGVGFE
jgi:hypothetical protein